jgi:uncharacterized protein YbdZ (MbtH family)
MPVSALIRAKGAIRAPIGLICAIPTATPIPTGWTAWSRAQDYFIRGTTSDSLVNTTATSNSISLNSTTDDLHLGSLARDCEVGYTSTCTTSCHTPSMNYNGLGYHGSHSIGFSYRPNGIRLKLIYASSVYSYLFPGLMMFSTDSLPQHVSITYLDQAGDRLLLSHASKTEYNNGSVTPNASTGSVNNSHIHTTAVNRQVYYLKVNEFTTVGAAGGAHTHTIPAPQTWIYKPKYVTLRSYHIADIYNPVGLIGMWYQSGNIPNGWQVVGEVNDRYIKFSSAYSSGAGNDTIEISGMTGNNAHLHPYGTSTKISRAVSPSGHYDSVSHLHYYSHTAYPFKPLTLYLKFIRYVGH